MLRRGSRFAALTLAALAAGSAHAQRTRLYADEDRGYEIRVPKWLEAVPSKPGDDHTLVRFEGTKNSTKKPYRGEQQLVLLVVRIPRGQPETGGQVADAETESESLAEQRVARLNSAQSIDEYLRVRGIGLRRAGALVPNPDYAKRPIEDPDDRPYEVLEQPAERGGAVVRAFVQRDAAEVFGVVAVGYGLNPFEREVVSVVKSLRREVRRPDKDDDGDPYADSDLRDIPRRRDVRGELVHGWTAHDSENFILVTNVTSSRIIERMLVDLEIMRTAYFERFPPAEGANMDAVSTVRLCHGYEDYLQYAGRRMMGTGGYWNFVEEELVLFNPERKVPRALLWTQKVDPSAVLYHEAMHQYFHYSNRAAAPGSWFNEGYGEVFGGARLDRHREIVKSIGKNDHRLDLIRLDRKKKNDPPQLADILRMTQGAFYGRDSLRNYAYSWSFCYFLEEHAEKPDRSRNDAWAELPDRYLAELRKATEAQRARLPQDAPEDWIARHKDEIQAVAIEAALEGIDMPELQEEWERFVKRL